MAFLRPEAKATLWRWREVLTGIGLGVIGLWWIMGPGLLLGWLGYVLVFCGLVLVWIGGQRGRFRLKAGGAGAVQVDEGQISYFGPLTGGMVALRELERLSLDGTVLPAHWRLDQKGQQSLLIPVDAEGAEALFDAFAVLPGLQTERMLAELKRNRHQAVVIWERAPLRPAGAVLH